MTMHNKEALISATELRALLNYNPTTGVFTWATSAGGVLPGSIAGNKNSNGYMVVGLGGVKYRQHRLAWLHTYGEWPIGMIDHVNGDRTDNRISNLRDVSRTINMQNRRAASIASASGVLGVYFSRKCGGYMASVTTGGKKKRRGPYASIERAAAAYLELKRKHHEGCTL